MTPMRAFAKLLNGYKPQEKLSVEVVYETLHDVCIDLRRSVVSGFSNPFVVSSITRLYGLMSKIKKEG